MILVLTRIFVKDLTRRTQTDISAKEETVSTKQNYSCSCDFFVYFSPSL